MIVAGLLTFLISSMLFYVLVTEKRGSHLLPQITSDVECLRCEDWFTPYEAGDAYCKYCIDFFEKWRTCKKCNTNLMIFGSENWEKTEHDECPKGCDVPGCTKRIKVTFCEYGWGLCDDHAKWFKERKRSIEKNFPLAVKYLVDYDDWRFQAELQNYPDGCYDDMIKENHEKTKNLQPGRQLPSQAKPKIDA